MHCENLNWQIEKNFGSKVKRVGIHCFIQPICLCYQLENSTNFGHVFQIIAVTIPMNLTCLATEIGLEWSSGHS